MLKKIIALILLCAPLYARADALEQFRDFVANTKTLQGEFIQRQIKVVVGGTQTAKNSSGVFSFSRPAKFIWMYKTPYEQVLQADGHTLYIYDKDLNQVSSKKVGDILSATPAAILLGGDRLEKDFVLKDAGVKGGLAWLDVMPKARDTSFVRIRIGMADGVPTVMELHDAFGQISLLSLTKLKRNVVFAADYFKFVVPKGADVLAN